jgi:hypothetical protein
MLVLDSRYSWLGIRSRLAMYQVSFGGTLRAMRSACLRFRV